MFRKGLYLKMKRIKPQGIKELLQEYIKHRGLTGALNNARIYSAWNEAVGENIASYTKHRYFKNGVLLCNIDSSAVRNYLNSNKAQIIEKLNGILEKKIIKELIIR